ncbi:glycosyltransferase [Candidatus Falkowbacteria bacterium]|jgi:glycosyltransferase involved in cell wall biosynthesis|nr:glycosyltransferase [Candidatus Falkowbacteria bacterium]MBT5503714.1 glycosyltransferase [Candidatus Falkowbacteria bacterium]MBT6573806.1 glycosyltransferase [Candidatus Falkowbacteria bacterium]MBT7348766.1 glycosyltransferase [Candidatus Falkowbacteria bacterium]MBT7500556.1 glycosyltransferase [Candidatus Falkowbacteria bacterium]
MNVALVHDHLTQDGGAERVAKAFMDIFPKSSMYTLVYDKKNVAQDFAKKKIHTSFLQNFPFGVSKYQWYLNFMPAATEHHPVTKYKLILSSSSIFSKGVIPGPTSTHICYCHTPPRFLWTNTHGYLKDLNQNFLIKKMLPISLTKLRQWDKIAADRVDHFIANSKEVQKRIKKYYNKESTVIYPPVDTHKFKVTDKVEDYFLAGGRLVGYKRFDLIVQAFNRLNLPLKIFGDGPQLKNLKKIAKNNIEFLGKVPEQKKIALYSKCKAFLNPQLEDFGITAVEAMASGRPVIAYRAGGATETVIEGKTGTLFEEQIWEDLADKVLSFKIEDYNPQTIREHALQFDVNIFKQKIKEFIVNKLNPNP